jgi:PAS domain S-box-containing protein
MRAIFAGTAIAIAIAGLFATNLPLVQSVNTMACDFVTVAAGREVPSSKVAIVEIDEAGISRYGRWPWPRDLIASLVRRTFEAGAGAVVLDMALTGEESGDEALAGAMRGHPVAVGFLFRFDKAGDPPSTCGIHPLQATVQGPVGSSASGFYHPSGAVCISKPIAEAASATGFLNALIDRDGRVHTLPVAMEFGGNIYPGLALAALHAREPRSEIQLRLGSENATAMRFATHPEPLEGHSLIRLHYRGPGRTYPYFSVSQILDGAIGAGAVRDRIVVIGGSALGLPNPVATPFDSQFPDIEVQATAIDNLVSADLLQRPSSGPFWEVLLALAAGIFVAGFASRRTLIAGGLLALAFVSLTWLVCILLVSRERLLFSPLPISAIVVAQFPAVALIRIRHDRRMAAERERFLAEASERRLETERERGRQALARSELRYRQLVESVNEAIMVDDARGRIVFANQRFREWFGITQEDPRGLSFEDYVAPGWRQPLREWRNARLADDSSSDRFEYEGVRQDGSRIWLEALVTRAPAVEDAADTGAQWSLRDVTSRREMEARYLQAQKMEIVGRLSGGVAHDFNNLLQVINGYTDLILGGLVPEDQIYDDLLTVRQAGERAVELTRNLLTFSRREVAKPRILNINDSVAEAGRICRRLIGEDVDLEIRLSAAPAWVLADPGQMIQILMNLLVNARDAMPDGGSIVMETEILPAESEFARDAELSLGERVCLRVIDNGSGMTDEVKRHLFEPFFTTKGQGKGTGLGLATVYGIVQQSAGKIEVFSESEKGTTFQICFPLNDENPDADQSAAPVKRDLRGSETVLLVEDQPAVRQYINEVLEQRGYRVIAAENGVDALDAARSFEGSIDLLITDLIMPVMDGRQLGKEITAVRPNTRILFISGYARDTMEGRWSDSSELVYLQKPFSPEELATKVSEILGHAARTETRSAYGA